MESAEDDEDLKLVQASAGLLDDLEASLPKLLWKHSKTGNGHGRVHTHIKRRDLEYIEPFQGEPQLLDARLKHIVPPIVEAYIKYLQAPRNDASEDHVDFQGAVCVLLYTLCKVRGCKVILGFFNNEPRYLEAVLQRLQNVLQCKTDTPTEWQVPYVLLLWLSHLLLTPFDLASISNGNSTGMVDGVQLHFGIPELAARISSVALSFLPASTKAQDAASTLLVRLVLRPDMQKLRLADAVVANALRSLQDQSSDPPTTIYQRLGHLRFLAGLASSPEVGHLIPDIYRICRKLSEDETSTIVANAVSKKLLVKVFRNIAVLSLRSADAQETLLSFLESTSVLEEVVDYLLRSLGDRDTPVRYAAAKALSLLILELGSSMGQEVIQAILDTLKEDMPREGNALDFRTVSALKWHGLTLALSHTLFKRSAAPEQLPDIVSALVSALQFEQRTATGSSVGTNVRDAANFGLWSVSRRYTTAELLSVDALMIPITSSIHETTTVIQLLANQLILAACLDPAGNIRRGSSAALQELIGRHPNQVNDGIAIVQIVDYQAVGLRRRAMVDVANRAAELHGTYWNALLDALLGWRGLGSSDVPSREAAAASLAMLSTSQRAPGGNSVLKRLLQLVCNGTASDVESLHGLILALAILLETCIGSLGPDDITSGEDNSEIMHAPFATLEVLQTCTQRFNPRLIRSELSHAIARFLAALCRARFVISSGKPALCSADARALEVLTERLLSRHEDAIQHAIPPLVQSLLALKRGCSIALGSIAAKALCKQVIADGSRSTLSGACGAIALGALAPLYENVLSGDKASASIDTLAHLTSAINVDWRIIGVKALQLAVEGVKGEGDVEPQIARTIVDAVHRGLNDYTIDERGDVGSLVRLQAITCVSRLFATSAFTVQEELMEVLHADLIRLSLEKLDRVRLAAAQCRHSLLGFELQSNDIASVSSYQYFLHNLGPLRTVESNTTCTALLEGCISCTGISAEPLLEASRSALVEIMNATTFEQVRELFSLFAGILKDLLVDGSNVHPALELLAFLFDMQIPQRLSDSDFRWRNLLSSVQKSHHKSNDIPKILAAVHVYRGLADIPSIRDEVLKKLVSMLKTNPYPTVRLSVAETLFMVVADPSLKDRDWSKPVSQHLDLIGKLQECYAKG